MPSTITHAIPAITVGLGLGRRIIPLKAILLGAIIANIPDLDIIGPRWFGVPHDSIYAHRGFTHSISFAILTALIFALIFARNHFKKYFVFFSFCALSHSMLDSCNHGSSGVPFLWPITEHKFHSFFQPIKNINVSLRTLYTTTEGFPVFLSEIIWVWVPFLMVLIFLKLDGIEYFKSKVINRDS